MCGINGIYSFTGTGAFTPAISAMNDSIAHRGPDDQGIFTREGLALGHRRLSIIDLSTAGHQPMHSAFAKQTIVFNGEMYNYREVRAKLGHFGFKTQTDTEVILAAWKQWGPDCLQYFNGMFAFLLWDEEKQELFVVRDRLGVKPIYYSHSTERILFSSELRGLLASGMVERKIDEQSLEEYIRYQCVHAPATILRDVKMLLPGHYMRITQSGVETIRWWKPTERAEVIPETYERACEKVNGLFSAAIERRLVSDVPFGAFLSGGIDSSAVVGMMSRVSGSRVKTFNISFDNSEFSESVYARQIAEKFRTDHHEITLTPEHFLEKLPDALNAMDHPSGDGPNTYVVSEATKNAGITMALSGLGGDELFAGYDVFKRAVELEEKKWIGVIPRFARSAGGKLLKTMKPGVASEKIADVLSADKIDFNTFYPKSREVYGNDIVKLLLAKNTGWKFPSLETVYGVNEFHIEDNFLSQVSLAEITTYMQNTLLRDTDQMSMAHALEVRVPFLDYELVNFVLNIPDEWKYPETPKKLLVDSLGDLLPKEIVDRPKMGFTFPWKQWMKMDLRAFCEEHLEHLGNTNVVRKDELMRLWRRFLADDKLITWSRIWHLVVLAHWMKTNNVHG